MQELKRVIEDSEIMEEDDALWPPPDRVGRQVSISVVDSNQSALLITVFEAFKVRDLPKE
jgi:hypothetical protein